MSTFFEVAFQFSFALFIVFYFNYFILQNAAVEYFLRQPWTFILRTSEKIASFICVCIMFLVRCCAFVSEVVASVALYLLSKVIRALLFVALIPLYLIGTFNRRPGHADPAVQPVDPAPAPDRDVPLPENPRENRNLNGDATAAATPSGPSGSSTATTIATLEAELQIAQAEANYHREQSKFRQRFLDRLHEEYESLWQRHLPCKDRTWGLKCRVKSLERVISAQAQRLMELTRQSVESDNDRGSLQEANQQQDAQIAHLWSDKQVLDTQVQSLNEQLQAAKNTITELQRSDALLQTIKTRLRTMASGNTTQRLASTVVIDTLVTSGDLTLGDLGISPTAFEESMRRAQATLVISNFHQSTVSSNPTTNHGVSTPAVSDDSSATPPSTEPLASNRDSTTPEHASSSTPATSTSNPTPAPASQPQPQPQQPPRTPNGTPMRLNAWQNFCMRRNRPYDLNAAQLASMTLRTSNENSAPNPPPAPPAPAPTAPAPTSPSLNRSGSPLPFLAPTGQALDLGGPLYPSISRFIGRTAHDLMDTDSLYDLDVRRQAEAAALAANAMDIDSEGQSSLDEGVMVSSIERIWATGD
ncbi:hypothetical protein E8E13_006233 [Curvularia kusanoi]|uniref:Uncharacterized protein n=1 Tax=Curvularia kusanoi TaxID=90978 RepID=A0A9P4T937_CURKU|nr:hypothetical protein E8E13_006233 [Curvularia kusanoi]